jgi:hypothetical protein
MAENASVTPLTPVVVPPSETPSKSFSVRQPKRKNILFELVLEQADGQELREEFHARATVPGELLLDMAASGAAGPEYQAASLRRFFSQELIPEDRERWQQALAESNPPITMEHMMEIVDWLMEVYSNRPTPSA